MYKEQRLLNKKTIVTGGARGIGAGIVKRLYAEGAEIIISDFREELALDLIQELDQDKGNISFHKTDLSKEEEIIKLFKFANSPKIFLEIDGLHNDGFLTSGDKYINGIDNFIKYTLKK